VEASRALFELRLYEQELLPLLLRRPRRDARRYYLGLAAPDPLAVRAYSNA
jgi:hypothetical protein